jgi:hypothetical protein
LLTPVTEVPGTRRVTPAFQAALAAMVTNERAARLYLDGGRDETQAALEPGDRDALRELARRSGPRLLTLASLLSQRRFKRAAQLLPATRERLGEAFEAHWPAYLEAAVPGMPSATEEAVRFARFLRGAAALDPLSAEVLRYEESLNEESRRLVGRTAQAAASGDLADGDRIRLSDHVLVERFACDVIAAVKALRQSAPVPELEQGSPCAVLFRPRNAEGVTVDVSILPQVLASCLAAAVEPTPVETLVATVPAEARPALRSRLEYLLRAGILILCPDEARSRAMP